MQGFYSLPLFVPPSLCLLSHRQTNTLTLTHSHIHRQTDTETDTETDPDSQTQRKEVETQTYFHPTHNHKHRNTKILTHRHKHIQRVHSQTHIETDMKTVTNTLIQKFSCTATDDESNL